MQRYKLASGSFALHSLCFKMNFFRGSRMVLVQFANLNIRVADYFVEQSMKIVLLVYNMVFYNIRRSAHLSESLGPPGGPPKEKRN